MLTIITLTFLLAGCVKGVIGLGLPSVSLALLTVATDLTTAMTLMLIPSFVTNLWQALVGGHAGDIARSLWPFLLTATAAIWIGALALNAIDPHWLSALLGALLAAYALINLLGYRCQIHRSRRRWAAPLFGTINGVLTGMTGSFVVPGVMYLQATGLPRDTLIQAMGMLFTLSTVALAIALQNNQLLTPSLLSQSALAVPPALAGMVLGQKIRRALSEQLFRKIFFIALLLLASYIVLSAILH